MLTVLLLRHASAAHGGTRDHDRPLDTEGRAAAVRVGTWLAEHAPDVDAVLCSSATRAQQTWEHVRESWQTRIEAEVDERLYMATPGALFERLQALGETVSAALLVGHNPAMQQLGLILSGGGERYKRLRSSLPTAGLARITLPASAWGELQPGSGELTALVTPTDRR